MGQREEGSQERGSRGISLWWVGDEVAGGGSAGGGGAGWRRGGGVGRRRGERGGERWDRERMCESPVIMRRVDVCG